MKYKNLGRSGLKVSELSFGSWLTFGDNLDLEGVRQCMKKAFDMGVNFFDNAEGYARGESESLMGEALRLFRREDLVISTKIYWGGNGPNDTGLSWKHLVEGTRSSLRRLKLHYVDILFCHRPDLSTPLEETVRAMDYIIRSGYAFYWGTSEWPAERIEKAFELAEKLNCVRPIAEQPQYNLLSRGRVEREYAPLYSQYGLGLTTWSPLASGVLTGKYGQGTPRGSRLERNDWLRRDLSANTLHRVESLVELAREIDCSPGQLAIAWCLKNPNVTSVITGATSVSQIEENLRAAEVKERIGDDVLTKLDKLFT